MSFLSQLKEQYYSDSMWLNTVSNIYYQELTENPAALEYCFRDRKLFKNNLQRFMIGLAPSNSKQLEIFKKIQIPVDVLQRNGIADPANQYCRFENRIMFPYQDLRQNIIGFSGRLYLEDSNQFLRKYLHSPSTVLFQKSLYLYGLYQAQEEIIRQSFVIIVEGNLDVVSLHRIGIENVVGCSGTAFTENQLSIIQTYTDTILFWFDNDEAGNKAWERVSEVCKTSKIKYVRVAVREDIHDPDQAACIMSIQDIQQIIEEAYARI